ncbi:3835_t:CDS:10 [Acaulospora colombiana]|uniref:3835_t:CDS:1 n=1 Tax=Acaulospora colombiana TaxID=27376 RepID=A0ACA9L540_9GLOM|nr:3835_t:CDS:10 [Acaulospora colombiana]
MHNGLRQHYHAQLIVILDASQSHNPATIIAPDTFFATQKDGRLKSVLLDHLYEEFPKVPVQQFPRRFWNDEAGLNFITELSLQDDERAGLLVTVHSRYYALQAVAALFKYIEATFDTIYPPHTLVIKYRALEETARNLELIEGVSGLKVYSLYGILNGTFTPQGARLLRTTLLSPINSQTAIDARLDAVAELVRSEETYTAIRDALRGVQKVDLDKLVIRLAAVDRRSPANGSVKVAFERMGQLLDLQKIIKNVPAIGRAARLANSQLLKVIGELVSDPRIGEIAETINDYFNDYSTGPKKADRNPLLDVARASYKENIHDIFDLGKTTQEKYEVPVELVYLQEGGGGFHFSLLRSVTEDADWEWPQEWIDRTLRRKKWIFSSLDLKKLNARMREMLEETLMISARLHSWICSGHLLSALSVSISTLVQLHTQILRPEFTGTLAIKSGRHPVMEGVRAAGSFVSNDVFANESVCFQIIQGPKYVIHWVKQHRASSKRLDPEPLPFLILYNRLFDSLLTRLSNEDDSERSLSTFSNEMATTSMILGLSTKDSLVLIDELGRGTSAQEGVGIAHAIAEELIERKDAVQVQVSLLLYHHTFPQRHLGYVMEPQKKTYTMVNFLTNSECILDLVRYCLGSLGLELARLADLPDAVTTEAKRVAAILVAHEQQRKESSQGSQISIRRKAILTLATQLKQILRVSTLPDEELARYLLKMQNDIGAKLDSTIISCSEGNPQEL